MPRSVTQVGSRVVLLGRVAVVGLMVAFSLWPSGAKGQWLEALRSEVREPPATPSPDRPPNNPSPEPPREDRPVRRRAQPLDDDDDDNWGWKLGALLIAAPYWAPIGMAHDHYDEPSYFSPIPYFAGSDGLMVGQSDVRTGSVRSPVYPMMARVRAEFGHDLDDLSQTRLHALIESHRRIGVDGTVTYRHESVGTGDDELLTGDLNLLFRFAQSPRLQMRSGLGVNWLSDQGGMEAGFNFTYGGDYYFARPWVISAEIDAGSLGDSGLFHVRSTLGVVLRGIEIYTGFDRYDVDHLETNQWVTGIGVWF